MYSNEKSETLEYVIIFLVLLYDGVLMFQSHP
jgi:hypothetical protein